MGDMNEIKDLEKPDFSSQEMYDDTNLVPENNSDTISFKKVSFLFFLMYIYELKKINVTSKTKKCYINLIDIHKTTL